MTRPQTLIHLGSGAAGTTALPAAFAAPDWRIIRVDLDANCQPDVVADMRYLERTRLRPADAVWSTGILQHQYDHEVQASLRGMRQLLKPGGVAVLSVPDLQTLAELIANDQLDTPLGQLHGQQVSAFDLVFGLRGQIAHGRREASRRSGFTARSLGQRMIDAGFASVSLQRDPRTASVWALGFASPPAADMLAQWQAVCFPHPVAAATPTEADTAPPESGE